MVETKTKIQRYDSYKDSGVAWLGEIPEHWGMKRFKFLAESNKGKLPSQIVSINDNDLPPYMSMEYLRGGEENQWVKDNNAFVIDENEILLLWDGSNSGEFLKSRKGVISSTVAHIIFSNINKHFAWYHSKVLEIELRKNTIGMGIPHVSGRVLNNLTMLLPPLSEQTKIAQFLDDKTTKIENAISIKEEQISLLKERELTVIEKSVTNGLNSNIKFKDSGVRWLDKIPEHWEVVRSKRLFEARKERARKGDEQLTASQKYGVIPQQKYMELEGRRVTQVEFNPEILKRVEKGDFVISMRSFQGGIEYCDYNGCVSSAYVPLIPIKHVEPSFYKYLLKSRRYINELSSTSNLVRDGQALRFDNFSQVDLLIIPIEEQKEIASFLDRQVDKTAKIINLKQQEIARLKEYKRSLINGVVTGKVKVC